MTRGKSSNQTVKQLPGFVQLCCLLIILSSFTSSCGTVERTEQNRISKNRPPGSKCRAIDSASVRKALCHPNMPTGGWHCRPPSVDYSRTRDLKSNCLVNGAEISGYVKFDEAGYLRARCYDDYYGDVYCGWSPDQLQIKPGKHFVFVSLGTCSVGDGGLNQVHEVAWFPEGKTEGTIVFSSAFPSGNQLDAADIYQDDMLGSEYYFNRSGAESLFCAYAKRSDVQSAQKYLDRAISILSKARAVNEKGMIPPEEVNSDSWLWILSYKLGASLEQPAFEPAIAKLEHIVNLPVNKSRSDYSYAYRDKIPIYSWFNNALLKKKQPLLKIPPQSRNVCYFNAVALADYLQSDKPDDQFPPEYKYAFNEFWFGAKSYLRGDYTKAKAYISERRSSTASPFELAAAARLIELMNEAESSAAKTAATHSTKATTTKTH